MRLILAATTNENLVMAVDMGGKSHHGPKVNKIEAHPREQIRPISTNPLSLRSQTSRTREKPPFTQLPLNWTCAIDVDQKIIGHAYAELSPRLLPSIIPA
ncbi:hypothetical protein ACFX12_030087 [Malus domestica]